MKAPFGSWQSPITSELIVSETIGLGPPRFEEDRLYWQEARPTEDGRVVVVIREQDGAVRDAFPAPYNARTRVHEYGGGAWVPVNDRIYFANFSDQQVYVATPGEEPRQLTNEPVCRFANFKYDQHHRRLICICESHGEGESEAENYLAAIDIDSGEVTRLASGHDFFSSPAPNPEGNQLAWITWNHPHMPWDATSLWLADITEDGDLIRVRQVAGGQDISIQQPRFAPDGALWFISDEGGWWNLYRHADGNSENICPMAAEFGVPHWQFGVSTYGFDPTGHVLCIYSVDNEASLGRIVEKQRIETIETPFTSMAGLDIQGESYVLTAASPTQFPANYQANLNSHQFECIARSCDLEIDPGFLARPKAIRFTTADDDVAHGFFYAPQNQDFEPPDDELPPLIVMLHGGPTSATEGSLNLSRQYWTSRGFAVLDVNYRGSTGYGREYRNKLQGGWGIVEVEDCVYGAQSLVDQQLVDPNRLAIRGGSAGGYTTLAALVFHDTFRAGASHYGIGDLEALARDTHKFESRYLDSLVGPYPEAVEVYRTRSPVHHVDGLNCPVIFFQGLEDRVVPPNQAEAMVTALKGKGIPVAYIPFPGEQHGFRQAANIRRALDLELYFYGRIFGFEPADDIKPVEISHLEG